jgi:hypothetical protein
LARLADDRAEPGRCYGVFASPQPLGEQSFSGPSNWSALWLIPIEVSLRRWTVRS